MARWDRRDESDSLYLRAIQLYQTLNLVDKLRSCLIEYAEELDDQGRGAEAKQHWKRAALANRTMNHAASPNLPDLTQVRELA